MSGDLKKGLLNDIQTLLPLVVQLLVTDCLSVKQTSFETKATAGSFSKTEIAGVSDLTPHTSEKRKDVISCETDLCAGHHGVRKGPLHFRSSKGDDGELPQLRQKLSPSRYCSHVQRGQVRDHHR